MLTALTGSDQNVASVRSQYRSIGADQFIVHKGAKNLATANTLGKPGKRMAALNLESAAKRFGVYAQSLEPN